MSGFSIIKRISAIMVAAMVISACSSSKQSTTATRNQLKGTWVLDKITYEGLAAGETLRITLLDEGNENCLVGSTWVLPNNGYGSYTITANQGSCVSGQKNIVWSYRKEGDQPIFQYKRLEGGVKAKDIKEGYRFRILSASDNALMLQSEISYEGKPIYINYSFYRS